MLDSSLDILYLVIAIAVAALTFFLCWLIYNMISIFREARSTIQMVEDRVKQIDQLIESIRDKVTNSSAYLSLLLKSVTSLVTFLQQRKTKKKNQNTKAANE